MQGQSLHGSWLPGKRGETSSVIDTSRIAALKAPLPVSIRWCTLSPWAALDCVAHFFGSCYQTNENLSPAPDNYVRANH